MFRVALAFVGTDGFSVANGLSTHLVEGAEVVRHMVAQSDRAVLLADSSKFERRGFVRVLGLADIDTIITDAGLSPEATRAIEKLGVEVILAGRRQEPTDSTPRPGGKHQED
jgi:DeoR/GlpR family transcriptional regulator of sugar metabolism